MVFSLASPKFVNNGFLMPVYTCDGDGISPPFEIKDAPSGVKSFVLIADDPDAPSGTWIHWLVFNIPPETRVIGEGEEPLGLAGTNSWGREGYGGPCPPSGTHRYFFKLYALDTFLSLPVGRGVNPPHLDRRALTCGKSDLNPALASLKRRRSGRSAGHSTQGVGVKETELAMDGHILAKAEIIGLYERKRN